MNPESNKLIGAGVFSAIAASLCCITPVLAFISGATGMAAAFSWMDPARPFLMGMTIVVLGFAWYQKLKPKSNEELQCACDTDEKPSFWQTKKFLGIVTVFAAFALAFPHYAHTLYPSHHKNEVIIVSPDDIQNAQFTIKGMTCGGCAVHVENEINKLGGVITAKSSYENASAEVRYDKSKVTPQEIEQAINSTGYKVVESALY